MRQGAVGAEELGGRGDKKIVDESVGVDTMPRGRSSRSRCLRNNTAIADRAAALPAYFMRHWPERSVTFEMTQSTYEGLAGWGRTRFQIVGGQLYYPDLKHNTFGCVVRSWGAPARHWCAGCSVHWGARGWLLS